MRQFFFLSVASLETFTFVFILFFSYCIFYYFVITTKASLQRSLGFFPVSLAFIAVLNFGRFQFTLRFLFLPVSFLGFQNLSKHPKYKIVSELYRDVNWWVISSASIQRSRVDKFNISSCRHGVTRYVWQHSTL